MDDLLVLLGFALSSLTFFAFWVYYVGKSRQIRRLLAGLRTTARVAKLDHRAFVRRYRRMGYEWTFGDSYSAHLRETAWRMGAQIRVFRLAQLFYLFAGLALGIVTAGLLLGRLNSEMVWLLAGVHVLLLYSFPWFQMAVWRVQNAPLQLLRRRRQ